MQTLTMTMLACALAAHALADARADRLHEIEHFFEGADAIPGPAIVTCTLPGSTQTECFSITVKADPQTYIPGPLCPTSITGGADKGGIWLRDGDVHAVDGVFISDLTTFYGDDEWPPIPSHPSTIAEVT